MKTPLLPAVGFLLLASTLCAQEQVDVERASRTDREPVAESVTLRVRVVRVVPAMGQVALTFRQGGEGLIEDQVRAAIPSVDIIGTDPYWRPHEPAVGKHVGKASRRIAELATRLHDLFRF